MAPSGDDHRQPSGLGRFQGRTALVVGAGSGIGAASALRLASEGAQVMVGDIDLAAAERTVATIVATGATAVAAQVDVESESSVQALFGRVADELGVLDVLHSNAADTRPETIGADTNVLDIDLELWSHVFDVALRGFVLCCRGAIPLMLANGGGAIVATSSDGAIRPLPVLPAYCAAKAGLNSVVRHVAAKWGRDNIRCNIVSPGRVETGKAASVRSQESYLREIASTRLGVPTDIAAAVAYLLSDEAEWVNGQLFSVNGGALMR